MKVLGKTDQDGLIVEMGIKEFANLTGYYSNYDKGFDRPEVGDEVDISAIYRDIEEVLKVRRTLRGSEQKIRAALDILRTVPSVIKSKQETSGERERGKTSG